MLWSGNDVTLINNGGSITQDTAAYGTAYNHSKTIYAGDDITLTAQGAAGSHINTGVQTLNTAGNLVARASGSTGGLSIRTIGRVDGNGTFTNTGGGNTTGAIQLGTTLGSVTDLDDTDQVMDIRGNVIVKSNGAVGMYGGFGLAGTIDVIGSSLTAQSDKWSLNFTRAQTSTTTGTGIDIRAYNGSIVGSTLSTAGSANVYLQAGNTSGQSDKIKYINLNGLVTAGDLDATAYGSSNGQTSGTSISITGSTGGSTTTSAPLGGSVSTP